MRNIFNLLLAFIISLTAGLTITAQVSYSKIGDNPNFSDLAIRPNIGAIVGMGFGATYGIDAEYRKPNLPVQLRIVYDRSFFGDQNMSTRPNAMPLQRMDVGVGYPIIKKTKTKNVQVILSSRMVSSSSSSETYNIKYVDVEGIVEKQVIARTGFYSHRDNWITSAIDESILVDGQQYVTVDGTFIAKGFYAGLSFLKRQGVTIDTDEYGEKSNKLHLNYYFDVIITPSVSLGTYTDSTGVALGVPGKVYDIDTESNLEVTTMGWRVGMLWNNVSKTKLFFRIETGFRPAIKGQGYFFTANFGIAINKG